MVVSNRQYVSTNIAAQHQLIAAVCQQRVVRGRRGITLDDSLQYRSRNIAMPWFSFGTEPDACSARAATNDINSDDGNNSNHHKSEADIHLA
eukprot:scaffold235436_cov18-Prasinocladus_malaysianus.AAC.1